MIIIGTLLTIVIITLISLLECCLQNINQACVSGKTRKLYRPEKPFLKLRPAYSVELVSWCVVKGIKIKMTAKFRDTEHLRFEDTKRIMSPVKFRDFRETRPRGSGLSLLRLEKNLQ